MTTKGNSLLSLSCVSNVYQDDKQAHSGSTGKAPAHVMTREWLQKARAFLNIHAGVVCLPAV
jgi:hypothetical protein